MSFLNRLLIFEKIKNWRILLHFQTLLNRFRYFSLFFAQFIRIFLITREKASATSDRRFFENTP
jgi:hypothetical protein